MKDDDRFPFGQHKGRRMKDVPVRYLHWVWENCESSEKVDPVRLYIKENLEALQTEDEDLIWTI